MPKKALNPTGCFRKAEDWHTEIICSQCNLDCFSWKPIIIFVCEMSSHNLQFSSVSLFQLLPNLIPMNWIAPWFVITLYDVVFSICICIRLSLITALSNMKLCIVDRWLMVWITNNLSCLPPQKPFCFSWKLILLAQSFWYFFRYIFQTSLPLTIYSDASSCSIMAP